MIRIWIVALVALAGSVLAAAENLPDLSDPEVLAEAVAKRSISNLVIVDVRDPALFQTGHIPGSVNFPFERLFSDYPSKSAVAYLVIVGRPASSDARKAADLLRTRGYRNVILFGSISRWKGDLE